MDSRRSSSSVAVPTNEEFLRTMAHIRDKVKKRFLRKPLYLEAAHNYEHLANKQESAEFTEGVAMASTAAANAYAQIKRMGQSAENHTRAGRAYLDKELQCKRLSMPSINDGLVNGLEAYHRAIIAYEQLSGSSGVVGSLCYEVGSKLQELERYAESLWFLEKAVECWKTSPSMLVNCLHSLALSQVRLDEMEMAEQTYWRLDAAIQPYLPNASFLTDHQLTQISLVLLNALIRPADNNLTVQQRNLNQLYTGDSLEEYLDPDLFLTLQSVLQCSQARSFQRMRDLYDALVPFCEATQMYILDAVCDFYAPFS